MSHLKSRMPVHHDLLKAWQDRAERAEARARQACQTLVAAFGSVGPEDVEHAAERAAKAHGRLLETASELPGLRMTLDEARARVAELEAQVRDCANAGCPSAAETVGVDSVGDTPTSPTDVVGLVGSSACELPSSSSSSTTTLSNPAKPLSSSPSASTRTRKEALLSSSGTEPCSSPKTEARSSEAKPAIEFKAHVAVDGGPTFTIPVLMNEGTLRYDMASVVHARAGVRATLMFEARPAVPRTNEACILCEGTGLRVAEDDPTNPTYNCSCRRRLANEAVIEHAAITADPAAPFATLKDWALSDLRERVATWAPADRMAVLTLVTEVRYLRTKSIPPRSETPSPDSDAAFCAGWAACFNAQCASAFGGPDSDTPRTCDEALLDWKTRPSTQTGSART